MEEPEKLAREPPENANESARDQFAALGRFIQNFEFTVSVFRDDCARLIMGAGRGVSVPSHGLGVHSTMCSLVFHHEIMTARPLAEIWRALVIEQNRLMRVTGQLTPQGFSVVEGGTTDIHNTFGEVIGRRNKIVHASWGIGRWFNEDDFSQLVVEKYSVSKEGLNKRDDLPKTFGELITLGDEASRISDKLGRFLQHYIYKPTQIEKFFTKEDKHWIFVPPPDSVKT
jgi:hypothetical protein